MDAYGARSGSRTHNLLFTSQLLYPIGAILARNGTDERTRTSIDGFGDHCSAVELHPHDIWWGGQDSDLRTKKELSYSQPRLTTSLPPRNKRKNKNGVTGEIRTLAPVSRPTPLAGEPLQPLEYSDRYGADDGNRTHILSGLSLGKG